MLQLSDKRGEIRSLTGLRGIAACLVMFYHYEWRHVGWGPATTFFKHGYLAVDLFFLLSGFVMAMTYSAEFSHDFSLRTYAKFLLMRIARVYPLYLLVTIVCIAIGYVGHASISTRTMVSNAFLVQSWGISRSIVGPGWSISTEFGAYLLFPFLIFIFLFKRPSIAWVATAVAAGLMFYVGSVSTFALNQDGRNGPLDVFGESIYPLLRCVAEFSLGLVAWRVSAMPSVIRLAKRPVTGTLVAAVVVLAMAVPQSDVIVVLLFFPFIIALATEASSVAKFMGSWLPYWLGVISYSIYLVHVPVLDSLQGPVTSVLSRLHVPHAFSVAGALLIPAVMIISAITYFLVERPGRKVMKSLVLRRRQNEASVTRLQFDLAPSHPKVPVASISPDIRS